MFKKIMIAGAISVFYHIGTYAGITEKEKALLKIAPKINLKMIYHQLNECYRENNRISDSDTCKTIFEGIKQYQDINLEYFNQTYRKGIIEKIDLLNKSHNLTIDQKDYHIRSLVIKTIKAACQSNGTKESSKINHYKKQNALIEIRYEDDTYYPEIEGLHLLQINDEDYDDVEIEINCNDNEDSEDDTIYDEVYFYSRRPVDHW